MKKATITEAKNGLSALLDRVKRGETIVVTDRGVPVARIEPVAAAVDVAGRLARLERSGTVARARRRPELDRLQRQPARLADDASALAALLDERQSGR